MIDRKPARQPAATAGDQRDHAGVHAHPEDDEPILQKSAGKLRWIILDEAHTHIGPRPRRWRCCCAG